MNQIDKVEKGHSVPKERENALKKVSKADTKLVDNASHIMDVTLSDIIGDKSKYDGSNKVRDMQHGTNGTCDIQ